MFGSLALGPFNMVVVISTKSLLICFFCIRFALAQIYGSANLYRAVALDGGSRLGVFASPSPWSSLVLWGRVSAPLGGSLRSGLR